MIIKKKKQNHIRISEIKYYLYSFIEIHKHTPSPSAKHGNTLVFITLLHGYVIMLSILTMPLQDVQKYSLVLAVPSQ